MTPELREALVCAIRAAKLALFVVEKHGAMPNDSWRAGFDKDIAVAEAALARPSTADRGGEVEVKGTTKPLPEQDELRRLLRYEPDTGKLFWLPRSPSPVNNAWNAKHGGHEAFTATDPSGYRHGKVNGKVYQAHRIIWKLVHGNDPVAIDHRNGNPSDNSLDNLRECTVAENSRNYSKQRAGQSSSYRGVCWVKRDQKWAATISNGEGGKRSLGHYDNEQDAARAYDAAAVEMHGEFATLNFPTARIRSALATTAGEAGQHHHKLDNDTQVFFYEQDFYVLSNFSAFTLLWEGEPFYTSEAAYHWEKFRSTDIATANNVRFARSAHEAFKLAEHNKHLRRSDWDDVKVDIMRDILRAKADQHEYVRRKLLATGDRELVEDSWRDDFWGWGPNRDGKNMLGKLWMEVRAELRAALLTDKG